MSVGKIRTAREHSVSGAFVFLLLGVFAVFSTLLVLLSAQLYRGTVEQTQDHNDQRVLGSYLMNVVRGNDAADAVYVARMGETDALCFALEAEDGCYVTYVYCWDGMLCELFAEAGEEFVPEYGETICPAQAFHPSLDGQLLTMRLRNGRGLEQTLQAALVCDVGREALP